MCRASVPRTGYAVYCTRIIYLLDVSAGVTFSVGPGVAASSLSAQYSPTSVYDGGHRLHEPCAHAFGTGHPWPTYLLPSSRHLAAETRQFYRLSERISKIRRPNATYSSGVAKEGVWMFLAFFFINLLT